jgi:type IV fimbrial biogenesis protein FimT
MECTTASRRQGGMSLVESVVAVGVAAGALGLAAPALDDLLQARVLAGAAQDLLMDLHVARTEALKRNRRIGMCKSPDGERCKTGGGWEQGWIAFDDDNGNGKRDPGEERILRHGPLQAPLRLRGNQPVASYVSYTPLGATKLLAGGFQAGTLTLCRRSAGPTPARQVILNVIGRPRLQKTVLASCED